jgi:hypothetical protein
MCIYIYCRFKNFETLTSFHKIIENVTVITLRYTVKIGTKPYKTKHNLKPLA